MLLLHTEARERSPGRETEPADGERLLEGDRISELRDLIDKSDHRPETDDGFLHRKSAKRSQNTVEDERVQGY